MIIDIHAHVASDLTLPKAFYDGWIDNISSRAYSSDPQVLTRQLKGLFARYQHDQSCETLVGEMAKANIDHTVLLMIDFEFAYGECGVSVRELLNIHATVLKTYPGKFSCFFGADPRRGDEGLKLFVEAVEDHGFTGLKLYPPCGYSPSDPELYKFYEVCAQYGLPVLTHTGPTTSNLVFKHGRAFNIDEAAHRFPNVNFILAHAGVVDVQNSVLLAEYRPNVYLDIAGFQNNLKRGDFMEIMKLHKSHGIIHKILFGTDWPIFGFLGAQSTWVNAMYSLVDEGVLSNEELSLVMHGNAQRLLKSDDDRV